MTLRAVQRWLPVLLLAAGAALALLTNLGVNSLYWWDEPLYCGTTADMLAHDVLLYPTQDGRFFAWYGKGPLVNWLQAAWTHLRGWNVAALRAPTAVGMLAMVCLSAWQGGKFGGRKLGLWTFGIFLLSPEMLHFGRRIMLENLVGALHCVALITYATAWRRANERTSGSARTHWYGDIPWLAASSAALAAGILAKQAFALFMPAAIFLAECCMRQRAARWRLPLVGAVTLLASGWWFLWTSNLVGSEFWDSLVAYHIQRRFTEVLEGHGRGINAFGQSLDSYLGVLPWVLAAMGWWALRQRLNAPWLKFLWTSWTAFVLLEYLLVGVVMKTYLPWYQVVVMPPLFIGAAYFFQSWFETPSLAPWLRWAPIVALVAHTAAAMRLDSVSAMALATVTWALLSAAPKVRRALAVHRPWLVPLAIAVAAVVIVQPVPKAHDGRYAATNYLHPSSEGAVWGGRTLNTWKCYLPLATRTEFHNDCAALNAENASTVVLDDDAVRCGELLESRGYKRTFEHQTDEGSVQVYQLATAS